MKTENIKSKYWYQQLIQVIPYCFILFVALVFSCSEEKNGPLGAGGGVTDPISNVKVEPLPGGALITYDLPIQNNLLYVEAVLDVSAGKSLHYKSSSYSNNITIEGLGSTDEQEIAIYAVNKGGQKSQPVYVTIKPDAPPYEEVFKTLEIVEDFGGARIKFENDFGIDLGYILCCRDKFGEYIEYEGFYSQEKMGQHVFRGMEIAETEIALYIRDQWDNVSDTLFATLTPLYEENINDNHSAGFKAMKLANDAPGNGEWNIKMEHLWDGYYSQDYTNPYMLGLPGSYLSYSIDVGNTIVPQWITFDMGIQAKISRFRIHHYWRYIMFGARKWEMWGRPDEPPYNGSEEGWIKLCDMEQIRPSGQTGEAAGPGDAEAWVAGTSENADPDAPAVRYIRIKTIEAWSGFAAWTASELIIFGQPIN